MWLEATGFVLVCDTSCESSSLESPESPRALATPAGRGCLLQGNRHPCHSDAWETLPQALPQRTVSPDFQLLIQTIQS